MQILRTIVADDHPIFLEGLKSVLNKHPKFEIKIIAQARNGSELIDILRHNDADLLVMDLNMPGKDGLEVLNDIPRNRKGMRIIAITMYDDIKIVKAAFKAGVDGYILKGNEILELYQAISKVVEGETFMGVNVGVGQLKSSGDLKPAADTLYADRFTKKYNLTRREIEILRLISDALSNKEIASKLYISDQTVSVHRKNIMRKLGVSNTAGLVKVAYNNSLL